MGIHLGENMVYRKYHWEQSDDCDEECTSLTAYVRIEGKWTRIGYYGSECKKFSPLDLQQEEEDRMLKHRLAEIKNEMKRIRNDTNSAISRIKMGLNKNHNQDVTF